MFHYETLLATTGNARCPPVRAGGRIPEKVQRRCRKLSRCRDSCLPFDAVVLESSHNKGY